MSKPVYSQEFKEEAVRQVTERGHTVKDVAERLGVTTHSLYIWVRKARPGKPDGDALATSKQEIKKLKAELARVEEERDILKKAAAYFAKDLG
jgi:transposase